MKAKGLPNRSPRFVAAKGFGTLRCARGGTYFFSSPTPPSNFSGQLREPSRWVSARRDPMVQTFSFGAGDNAVKLLVISMMLALCGTSFAAGVDLHGPPGSSSFGFRIAVLPNGNFVVVDPDYSTDEAAQVGAAYLFASDGSLISTLTGSTPGDQVGNGGIVVLKNGNYVIRSWAWQNTVPADPADGLGAATWGSATAGVAGLVSAENSLVGETGSYGQGTYAIYALENGNYAIASPNWNDGAVTMVGAVTLGDGSAGTAGQVSKLNSLHGSNSQDQVGLSITPLGNGNYVVQSPAWSNGAATSVGAATWCDGQSGRTGAVSSSNSLVGAIPNDNVGFSVTALNNGNYVVASPNWHALPGFSVGVGAVTWASGVDTVAGTVSIENSFVGSVPGDAVGRVVTALPNGNFVVGSPYWNNHTGAATWGEGTTPLIGQVSTENSLVGMQQNDGVGTKIVALTNGNYVVASPDWSDEFVFGVGAATWGNGASGSSGYVTSDNSIRGTTATDAVGFDITALANGNYVVQSASWHNGSAYFAGAATWAIGTGPTSETVSAQNSLVGTQNYDEVGSFVSALSNGNYVIGSPGWANGDVASAGATTWGDGAVGVIGTISAANSLVGLSFADSLGSAIALSNGDYVVASSRWNQFTGIAAWANGVTGAVGSGAPTASLKGRAMNDEIAFGGISAVDGGNYVVVSPFWSSDSVPGAGAITLVHGQGSYAGVVDETNSVVGQAKGKGSTLVFGYDAQRDHLVVGRPSENIVTIFDGDTVFTGTFE